MRAPLDEQVVINASDQFWEQMLAMTLQPLSGDAGFCLPAEHAIGSVELSGAWQGRIEVRMTRGLAYQATAAMMMQPLDTVTEAESLDATREIANMIAGTIKSSLPRPCAMTVPEAAIVEQEYFQPVAARDALMVAFRHASGELMVRVWEQESLQAIAECEQSACLALTG